MASRRCLGLAVFIFATTLQGQTIQPAASKGPTVSGIVRDDTGAPLPDVEVGVIRGEKLQQFVTSDADGKFLLSGFSAGIVPLRIRRLGYAIQFMEVDSRTPAATGIEIILRTVPNELDEVMVAASDTRLRGFYERKQQKRSFAKFLEQGEIRRIGPTNSSDLFRTVPGIAIRTASNGNTIRIRGCQPMVWLDGQKVPGAELDEVIQPSEIGAIEFYPSNAGTPAQYLERENRLCGTVLVWTRAQ